MDQGFVGLLIVVAFIAGYLIRGFSPVDWIRRVPGSILQWIADRSHIIPH